MKLGIFLAFLCLRKSSFHNIAPRPSTKCRFMQIGSQVNKKWMRKEIEIYKFLVGALVIWEKLSRFSSCVGVLLKPEMKFVIFRGKNKFGFDLY